MHPLSPLVRSVAARPFPIAMEKGGARLAYETRLGGENVDENGENEWRIFAHKTSPLTPLHRMGKGITVFRETFAHLSPMPPSSARSRVDPFPLRWRKGEQVSPMRPDWVAKMATKTTKANQEKIAIFAICSMGEGRTRKILQIHTSGQLSAISKGWMLALALALALQNDGITGKVIGIGIGSR
jgi:hypothetical protein